MQDILLVVFQIIYYNLLNTKYRKGYYLWETNNLIFYEAMLL